MFLLNGSAETVVQGPTSYEDLGAWPDSRKLVQREWTHWLPGTSLQ